MGGQGCKHGWATWRQTCGGCDSRAGWAGGGDKSCCGGGTPTAPSQRPIHQERWRAQVGSWHLDLAVGSAGLASPEQKVSGARGDWRGSPCRQRAVGPQRFGWGTPRRERGAPWGHPVLRYDPRRNFCTKRVPVRAAGTPHPNSRLQSWSFWAVWSLGAPGDLSARPTPSTGTWVQGPCALAATLPLPLEGETHQLQSTDDMCLIVNNRSSSVFRCHREPAILNHAGAKVLLLPNFCG